ncbi:MAG TPA: acyl-CoA synthetase [Candidatus Dormibacteraeota bacterium]|nr:acyl-CoA synthetase [Candidatus Dormibacteraeota bacterium]
MTINLGDAWEAVADQLGDEIGLRHGAQAETFGQFEQRAACLAGALQAHGVGHETKVALYLYNANEYLEACLAAFKLRAVPVNVNYRYLADELHYLLDNADAEVVIYHGALAERVQAVRERLPKLRLLVQVATTDADRVPLLPGAHEFETLLAAHAPAPRIDRSPDDLIFLYTGGTTGLPKGVMWRHRDLFRVFSQGYQAIGEVPATAAEAGVLAKRMREAGVSGPCLAAAPLMHGMAWFTSMGRLMVGSTVISLAKRSFDAHELWSLVQEHRVAMCVIVGDAFARPMVRALEEAEAAGRPYDISSLMVVVSGGVMWTPPFKQAFLDRGVPMLIDGLGSSEATGIGMMISTAGAELETAKFQLNPTTRVFTEDGRAVEPGSGEIGLLAVAADSGIPLGYYKDEAKTANTFKVIEGVRYSLPGDWARIEADGSITLLGRGSVCINTGGEKVFPEEVEEALKLHPAVEDCTVVGIPDEKWGERIVAVVAFGAGLSASESELIAAARNRLAAYKAPKQVVVVERIVRSPAGKADYRWAKETAIRVS